MRIGLSKESEGPDSCTEVRNQREGKVIRLRSYERLQEPRHGEEGVMKRILHGIADGADCSED